MYGDDDYGDEDGFQQWAEETGKPKFEVKDSGVKATYGDGVQRDTTEGKPKFRLIWPKDVPYEEQLLYRVAMHYTHGGEKYGDRNWEKSCTEESLAHHEDALERHFHKFLENVQDGEDHAAAVVWNVNAVLLTRRNIERAKSDKKLVSWVGDDCEPVSQPDYPMACVPGHNHSNVVECGGYCPGWHKPGSQETAVLREVTSQMEENERANPSDAEVTLAFDIIKRRQAFHDREAAELLKRAPLGRDITHGL